MSERIDLGRDAIDELVDWQLKKPIGSCLREWVEEIHSGVHDEDEDGPKCVCIGGMWNWEAGVDVMHWVPGLGPTNRYLWRENPSVDSYIARIKRLDRENPEGYDSPFIMFD